MCAYTPGAAAAAAAAQRDGMSDDSGAAIRPPRVSQACATCAELHFKCDDIKPCRRCTSKNIPCRDPASAASVPATTAIAATNNIEAPNDDVATAQHLLRLSQSPAIARTHAGGLPWDQPLFDTGQISEGQPIQQVPHERRRSMSDNIFVTSLMDTEESSPQPDAQASAAHPLDPALMDVDKTGDDALASHARAVTNGVSLEVHDHVRDPLWHIMGLVASDHLAPPTTGLPSGIWTPRNIYDFGGDTTLQLDDLDLSFLDNLNPERLGSTYDDSDLDAGDTPTEPPLGVESLQTASTWRFRPSPKDSRPSNLHMPATDSSKHLLFDRHITPEPLSHPIRDQILAMAITAGVDTRAFLSFPSLEILDSLLQFFLAAVASPLTSIHIPTFYPSRRRPELCAAMIAAGAAAAPDVSMRKFGLVLQEAARVGIPNKVERDNSFIRDLGILQAAILCLKVGFWSGSSRKMELAESFMQPWTTMARRGGWFGRRYEHIVPLASDTGTLLENKWHKWVEQESRKRLSFQYFTHDTHASISLFINPVISHADLTLPLPWPSSLWAADSATGWKAAFLAEVNPAAPPPSMLALLQDMDLYMARRCSFDRASATNALFNAAWRMVWEYRQQYSVTAAAPNQWNNGTLLLLSRLEELKRLLECLRLGIERSHDVQSPESAPDTGPISNRAEMLLLFELLSMHLHMSLEDMHIFAGVEGHEEARRVYPSLRDWANTSSSRQAIWHACRLLRHARSMKEISDFNAVIVYQASLALWTWGVVRNSLPRPATFGISDLATDQIVILDEPAFDAQSKHFVAMGLGRPALDMPSTNNAISYDLTRDGEVADARTNGALQSSLEFRRTSTYDASNRNYALLIKPAEVMSVAIDLLASSYKSRTSRPPLVENLLELMGGLATAVSPGVQRQRMETM
ncbi:hypothetical protein ANO11243_056740 [Dothideomycetidae sp. 11243]|nr:hypothetical protein ANO11243_056740 [fungal sp. No.11243]